MPTYRGTVKDNVVVLPEGVELSEGQAVEVRILDVADHPGQSPTAPAYDEAEREEEFLRYLLAEGVISRIPRPAPHDPPGRKPIKVRGKPISQIIIEERR